MCSATCMKLHCHGFSSYQLLVGGGGMREGRGGGVGGGGGKEGVEGR